MTNKEEIEEVLREFSWGNFGYDDIDIGLADYPEYQEWVSKLADEILDKLGLDD